MELALSILELFVTSLGIKLKGKGLMLALIALAHAKAAADRKLINLLSKLHTAIRRANTFVWGVKKRADRDRQRRTEADRSG